MRKRWGEPHPTKRDAVGGIVAGTARPTSERDIEAGEIWNWLVI